MHHRAYTARSYKEPIISERPGNCSTLICFSKYEGLNVRVHLLDSSAFHSVCKLTAPESNVF